MPANIDALRIHERRTREHQFARAFAAIGGLGLRELYSVVDPEDLRFARCHDRIDGNACAHRRRDDVGQIELVLGIVAGEVEQPGAQALRGNRHESRIDLMDRALRVRRILLLDDRANRAILIAHDAPQALGCRDVRAEQRDRRRTRCAHKRAQRVDAYQGHVAIEHEDQMVVGYHRHRLHDRVSRAELHGLQNPIDLFVLECGLDLAAPMAVNHKDVVGGEPPRGREHVREQRLARESLQHFRQVGIHPLANTCCEDDDGERHERKLRRLRGGF